MCATAYGSGLEREIDRVLRILGVTYTREFSFPDLAARGSGRLLRFDFCVFKKDGRTVDYLIECQGRQHYMPVTRFGGSTGLRRQQFNDVAKRRYCMDHGILLLTIPYYDQDKISVSYLRDMLAAYGR